jgi:hypothetical protein
MRVASKRAFQLALKRFLQSVASKKSSPRAVRINTPLFASGLIRSIEVLDLIVVIEGLRGREVLDQEVTLKNLRSIQAITAAFWEQT